MKVLCFCCFYSRGDSVGAAFVSCDDSVVVRSWFVATPIPCRESVVVGSLLLLPFHMTILLLQIIKLVWSKVCVGIRSYVKYQVLHVKTQLSLSTKATNLQTPNFVFRLSFLVQMTKNDVLDNIDMFIFPGQAVFYISTK